MIEVEVRRRGRSGTSQWVVHVTLHEVTEMLITSSMLRGGGLRYTAKAQSTESLLETTSKSNLPVENDSHYC